MSNRGKGKAELLGGLSILFMIVSDDFTKCTRQQVPALSSLSVTILTYCISKVWFG